MKGLSDGQNWALHIAAAAATAAGAYAAYTYGRKVEAAVHEQPKKVFVLAVSLSFKDVGERDKWINAWLPMVEQVKANEPGTISYELCMGDTEPQKLLVYERYVDKAAYEEVHRNSEAMLKFKQATASIKAQVQGQSYYETNHGFM